MAKYGTIMGIMPGILHCFFSLRILERFPIRKESAWLRRLWFAVCLRHNLVWNITQPYETRVITKRMASILCLNSSHIQMLS